MAIPDPNDARTFESSKLRWQERDAEPHRERLGLIRELLELRSRHLVPRMAGQMRGGAYRGDRRLVRVEWMLADGSPWHMLANFGVDHTSTGAAPEGSVVYQKYVDVRPDGTLELAPGAVLVVRVESRP
jgi:maltooligosyltrehalose trehalohydrolase